MRVSAEKVLEECARGETLALIEDAYRDSPLSAALLFSFGEKGVVKVSGAPARAKGEEKGISGAVKLSPDERRRRVGRTPRPRAEADVDVFHRVPPGRVHLVAAGHEHRRGVDWVARDRE
ncbi:hypothetical protein THAOC_04817 [Thalassiosira oceanica]|uniref:Uncharacterized protein n=1 Tax=Thalassiosira oceanica TaxID=159749 RepID=K0TNI1_THAOC|nr:hypothetical protein THAOC_04817 [Thalassiosira oceanica]|eukprot:EJK73552.1 hypothetical protein THAOC_04817 [Thalassiosira oceanica]